MRATRRQALAGAAAVGIAAALPAPARADAEEDTAASRLTAALGVKLTTEVAYEAIANAGVLTNLLRRFLDFEREHIAQLEFAVDALGAEPPVAPSRAEIAGLELASGARSAARFAIGLELRAIIAYQNAIQTGIDPNVVRTCAGAMGTDAQQLVVLRDVAGDPAVPGPFETGIR
jgi:hypothetical protein